MRRSGWKALARDVDEPCAGAPCGRTARGFARRRITPRADGTFRVFVRPGVTTTYRLTGTGVAGPSLTITVAEAA